LLIKIPDIYCEVSAFVELYACYMQSKRAISALIITICVVSLQFVKAQVPVNDNCQSASYLCNNVSIAGNNQNAQNDGVPGSCLNSPNNGVWYTTTTLNQIGNVTFHLSNIVSLNGSQGLQMAVFSSASCNDIFNLLACDTLITADDSLTLVNVAANTNLYVLVCGAPGTPPAECSFSISATGSSLQPSAIFEVSPKICNYRPSITVYNVNFAPAPYQYALNGGAPGSSSVFSNLNPGTYTITISNAAGCTFSAQRSINTDSIISFTSFSSPADCNLSNGSIQMLNVTGGTGSFTYSLNNSNPTNLATFSNLAAGTYNLTISDGICDTTATVFVSANSGIQAATGSTLNAACRGSDGAISYPPNTIIGATGGVSYTMVPPPGNAQTNITGTFIDLPTGTYTIVIRDNNGNGCPYIDKVFVAEEPPPQISITSVTPTSCSKQTGTISVTGSGGTAPYSFSNGGVSNSSGVFQSLASASYPVILTDANGCSSSLQVTINYLTGDRAYDCDAGYDQEILYGESVKLNPKVPEGASVHWSPLYQLADSAAPNPTVSPSFPTKFTMQSIYLNGCVCIDEVNIKVVRLIEPINAFTPNGDGNNDVWKILNIENYDNVLVDVFDRWGSKIFHSTGYESGQEWDGTFLGAKIPTAVYYYVITFSFPGETKKYYYTGDVTVFR
jgi:gliding motility-associated-like protein